MDESIFPPANLVNVYQEEDGTRTLQRFEIFDEDGKYVRVDDQKGAISVCGELMPTTAGKKLNPDAKRVTVLLSDKVTVALQKRGKSAHYVVTTGAGHSYLLTTPHAPYADWWKKETAVLKLIPALERELSSKNPRSLEQVVSRLSRDVPGLQNDVTEFCDRFGAFVVEYFGGEASDLITEVKAKLKERGDARAEWTLPGDGERSREPDRDCSKGNEWACALLGLPAPVRTVPKKQRTEAKKRSRSSTSSSAVGPKTTMPSIAIRRSRYPTEDMMLEGAAQQPKIIVGKPVTSRVDPGSLLHVFTISEFVRAFGADVLGHDEPIEPWQLEEWVASRTVSQEMILFMSDLMTFIGNEGKDPSVKAFGAKAAAAEADEMQYEDDDDEDRGDEEEEDDDDKPTPIVPLGRLRRLVPYLNPVTWAEILRRFLHVFRRQLPRELVRDVSLALEQSNFGGLAPARKLEVLAFLVRQCLQSKRVRDLVDNSQTHIQSLKGECSKRVKEIKASYVSLLKKQTPPKPETDSEVCQLASEIKDLEESLEKKRASGNSDRSELAKMSRELTKLKRTRDDKLEELQEAYDEVVEAPKRRDAEIKEVKDEYDPQIREEKAMMRIEPLGQDRYRRSFWWFRETRDCHDVVFLHDPEFGSWSVIEDMDELQRFRDERLETRGIREKKLYENIQTAIPQIKAVAEEEASFLENARTRRSKGRDHVFGRVSRDTSGEKDEEEDDVEEKEKEASDKDNDAQDEGPPDEATLLTRMQSHLIKTMYELPKGCVKSADLERVSARVDSTTSAAELADVLRELEECVTSGWMTRSWIKDRASWLEACKAKDIPYPTFALLLYMLEFSIDRYYNPVTKRSEKPTGKTHRDNCDVCDKAGQLLMCDSCPRVFHMHCVDPPLLHIPSGKWSCPKCMRFHPDNRRRRPTRTSRRLAKNDDDGLDVEEALAFAARNPTRSSRAKVRYDEEDEDEDEDDDDDKDDDDNEEEGDKEGEKDGSDVEDKDDDEEDEEDAPEPATKKARKPAKKGSGDQQQQKKKRKTKEEDEEDFEDEPEDDDDESDSDSESEFGAPTRRKPKPRKQPTRTQPRRGRKRRGSDSEDEDDSDY